MGTRMEQRIGITDMNNFTNYLENLCKDIENKNINKNQHLKSLIQESKKDLVDMMDESYQDAFNIEIKRKNRG
jgi:hypothetical protein